MTARRKPKPFERSTAERSARAQRRMQHRERSLSTLLGFWLLCANARCRRNHTCIRDAHGCYERHWDAVPEDYKEVWGCSVKTRVNGVRTEQGIRHAIGLRLKKLMRDGRSAPDLLACVPGRPVDRLPTRW
jgi:hypothetical protein